MRAEWAARARAAAAARFHWRYKLEGLRVTRLVGGSPAGAPAAAEATLRESAALVDGESGRELDRYGGEYRVRYLLEDLGEGYKISRAAVLKGEGAA